MNLRPTLRCESGKSTIAGGFFVHLCNLQALEVVDNFAAFPLRLSFFDRIIDLPPRALIDIALEPPLVELVYQLSFPA